MSAEHKTADQYYRAGQFDEAERELLENLTRNPVHSGILLRLGELALWKNQITEAEKYLHKAEATASRLNRMFPMNMQLKSLLAMFYYRRDDFPQAARYFKEAAGPFPIPMLSDLKSLGRHLELFGNDPPYNVEGVQSTSIPFVISDPLPVVEVSINNGEPMPFLVDTGGAELIVNTETARKTGAAFAGTLSGAGGGTTGKMELGKVDRVQLGDITVHNVPIHCMNTDHMAEGFDNLPIQGIIGTRLLMHFLTTIDYPNGCLTLQPKTAETLPLKAVPFYLVQSHYILVHGTVNASDPMLLFVDTGLGGQGFSVDADTARKFGMTVDWSNAETGVAGFGKTDTAAIAADKITIGQEHNQIDVENLSGIVFKKPIEILGHRLGFYVGGVISHLFFREYALTLDFSRMQLLLDG